ncbi:hypothetical protein AMTRI_Chr07g76140 [Amborella trichopoda]
MCLCEEESNPHLFIHCNLALNLWSRILSLFGLSWVTLASLVALLKFSIDSPWPKAGRLLWWASIAATIWVIWTERNSRIFRGIKCEASTLFHKITSQVIFWASNHKEFKGMSTSTFLQNLGRSPPLPFPSGVSSEQLGPPPHRQTLQNSILTGVL